MKTYILSYDLVGTSETSSDYEQLIAHIKSFPNWARVNKSLWIVKTDKTAVQVRDGMLRHADANDRVFVAQHQGDAAWHNAMGTNQWLKDNL